MGFDHMLVSKLLNDRDRLNQLRQQGVDTTSDPNQRIRSLVSREVDGVTMRHKLADLCDEIRKIARGVKFIAEYRGKCEWVDGVNVSAEVWVYYPEDQYAFMRVGYGDFSLTNSDAKYVVYSRNIRNEKYNNSRNQYNMAMADTLDRAVKNVKKYMRRYDVREIADMTLDSIQTSLNTTSRRAANEYVAARDAAMEHKSFIGEMRSLTINNHQFNDPTFGEALKDMFGKLDAYTAKQNEQHHGYYVQVRQYMGEQVFDVIPVTDIRKAKGKPLNAHTGLDVEGLTAIYDELPSKLAALSMLEDNKFVEGLGHKISAVSYWVLHAR